MQRVKWIFLGLLISLCIYYMVYPFIDVFIYSIFIYYSTRPIFNNVKKILKGESISIIISLILIIVPISFFLGYLASVASAELLSLSKTIPIEYQIGISQLIGNYLDRISGLSGGDIYILFSKTPNIQVFTNFILGIVSSMIDILLRLVMVFLITYVFLRHGTELNRWFLENAVYNDKKLTSEFFTSVDKDLEQVFYGNMLTAFIVMILGLLVFTGFNSVSNGITVPYPVLLAVLCGIASLIPGVGVSLVWIPTTILFFAYGYLNDTLTEDIKYIGLFILLSATLVDFIPSWLIRAKISGGRIDETLMLLSYILGPLAFGISGILLGPIILVFTVNYMKIIIPKTRMI